MFPQLRAYSDQELPLVKRWKVSEEAEANLRAVKVNNERHIA